MTFKELYERAVKETELTPEVISAVRQIAMRTSDATEAASIGLVCGALMLKEGVIAL